MPTTPPTETPQMKQERLAADYGWAMSVLKGNPELNTLFNSAVSQTWTPNMFVAKLRATKWYQSRSESVRQLEVLKKADPSEYNRRVQRMSTQISDQYYAQTGRRLDNNRANKWAVGATMFNYDANEIRDTVGGMVESQKLMQQGLGGTLGAAEQQLRQAAADYGLDFSQGALASQLNNIARQTTDVTALVDNYRNTAKSRYAGFADQIDKGMTVRDIAEPYKQLMAKTLELSDKGISVLDKNIQKALTYRPPAKGGKPGVPVPMALWQFEADLKNDPRWNKTQNAQDSIMAAGRKVLNDMGLLGAGN